MAKTAAQLAAEAYEKQKRQNRYGTTGGYTVRKPNPVDKSQQAAQRYQQQKSSGTYQTTTGTTVKRPSKSSGSSGGSRTIPSVTMPIIKTATVPTKKYSPVRPTPNKDVSSVDKSQIVADAYKQKMAQYRQSMGYDDEESTKGKQNTGNGYSGPTAAGTFSAMLTPVNQAQAAADAYSGNKLYNQYGTRYGGMVENTAAESKNPYTGSQPGQSWTLDRVYTPTAATWQQDAGIMQVLQKLRGNTDQLYYTNEQGQQAAFPMQNLNLGNGRYAYGVVQGWDGPDNEIVVDYHGNRVTRGDLKRMYANGLMSKGNEAAYNAFISNYTLPGNAVQAQSVSLAGTTPDSGGYGMDRYAQAIIDAQQAQYDALNQALRNQQSGLNSLYDQNAADLYAQYVRSGLVLPEQMAGMATGAADSMLLQNDLNYQNNLNKNELERIAGLADLEAQMAQNQAEADLQAAQTAAEWAQMAYQQKLAEQQAAAKYSGSVGTANNNSDKPILTASQAMSAWENGYDTPEIRAALQYYYGYIPNNGSNAKNVNSGANSVSAASANLGAGLAAGTNSSMDKLLYGIQLNNMLRGGK